MCPPLAWRGFSTNERFQRGVQEPTLGGGGVNALSDLRPCLGHPRRASCGGETKQETIRRLITLIIPSIQGVGVAYVSRTLLIGRAALMVSPPWLRTETA